MVIRSIKNWAGFVKLSHTVFALPFALASMAMAARPNRGWPGLRLFLLILGAMVTARTAAMAFNRIADRKFDQENPRTAGRHLPTGAISLLGAYTIFGVSSAAFIVDTWFINRICFYLAPFTLLFICFYSLTKRFTDFTHIYLGVALGLAPLGAWLAVRGSLALQPIVLCLAVICWLSGFDIIYALQDYEFDRKRGLHSLVVRWGIKNSLRFAFIAHLLMWGLLSFFGLISRFRVPYFLCLVIILGSLLLEHWLAWRRDLKWINVAFFRLNALVSIVFLCGTVTEVVFPRFQFVR